MFKWAIPVSYVVWSLGFDCFPVVFDIVPNVFWRCAAAEPLQHSPLKKELSITYRAEREKWQCPSEIAAENWVGRVDRLDEWEGAVAQSSSRRVP